MAALETPFQFERDLRSGHKDWKREKDSSTKWAFGQRPLAGCLLAIDTLEAVGGSEEQRNKSRPRRKISETTSYSKPRHNNIVKTTRGAWELPHARVRSVLSAQEELRNGSTMSHSWMDLLQQQSSRDVAEGAADGFLYSFDRTESPDRPLALEVFVRSDGGRATEKLVEKEYEVLDVNGEALKGRKARKNLRGGPDSGGVDAGREADVVEDDGFELI